jgi:hypothetical protein
MSCRRHLLTAVVVGATAFWLLLLVLVGLLGLVTFGFSPRPVLSLWARFLHAPEVDKDTRM